MREGDNGAVIVGKRLVGDIESIHGWMPEGWMWCQACARKAAIYTPICASTRRREKRVRRRAKEYMAGPAREWDADCLHGGQFKVLDMTTTISRVTVTQALFRV